MSIKIEEMNGATAKILGDAAEAALIEVAERLGVNLTVNGGAFKPGEGTLSLRFTFGCKSDGGIPKSFLAHCGRYSLTPSDFGAEFVSRGHTYTISGVNPRRRKYPITAIRASDGKGYKFAAETVRSALGRNFVPVSAL